MLEGEKTVLRAMEPDDVDVLFRWENNTDIWEVSGTTAPFSKFVLQQFIDSSHNDIYMNRQQRLVIAKRQDQKTIGCVDLFDFDPRNRRAGIGILIAENSERGKGFASDALQLTIKYCFKALDLHQIFANVLSDNVASLALFQKANFQLCGTKKEWVLSNGIWKDEVMMQLINS